jgi:ABC-2 type transport system ATP-binding protein
LSVDGDDIFKNASKAKKNIGYLPEVPPVYPDMTVREYLSFVLDLKGIKRDRKNEEIKKIIDLADLHDVEKRMIRNLSKGFRQRVGFAEAMAGSPYFIILDEPTVGLDPRQLQEFRKILKTLKKDHVILISSHILSEVSEICDHVFIISHGKLVMSDDTENLKTRFENIRKIRIKGIGDGEHARMSLLDSIEDISDVSLDSEDAKGQTDLTISYNGEKDLRGQISQVLVSGGFTILEMREDEQSLEDVFLELTENDDKKGSDDK